MNDTQRMHRRPAAVKRIGISLRQDAVAGRDERRDALDARWAPLLEGLGLCPLLVPNGLHDVTDWALTLGVQGLLLSGGNDLSGDEGHASDRAPSRDRTEQVLLQLAQVRGWPVLGVCRGMQMIQTHLGGRLDALAGHVGCRHMVRPLADSAPAPLRRALQVHAVWPTEGLDVNSYHRFGLSARALAPGLRPWLVDAQGHVEALEHVDLRWAAVMWHPEREAALQPFDRALLQTLFDTR